MVVTHLPIHSSLFNSMKKSTDAPVRLMQISAPISPPLSAGQNNPYRDIGVGRPPPGRGKKPSSQRLRQEQHEVCGSAFSCVSWKRKRASLEGASGREAMFDVGVCTASRAFGLASRAPKYQLCIVQASMIRASRAEVIFGQMDAWLSGYGQ